MLGRNKLADTDGKALIKITQDHDLHIEIHGRSADTEAKNAHIHAHNMAKLLLRDNQALRQNVDMMKAPTPIVGGATGASENAQQGAQANMQAIGQPESAGQVQPVSNQPF